VARNVVSTTGTAADLDRSDAELAPGSERRAAARSRSVISASDGATLAWSDGTTTKSCGPPAALGFAVDCIGPPCPVQTRPRPADDRRIGVSNPDFTRV